MKGFLLVFIGVALGIIIGYYFMHYFENKENHNQQVQNISSPDTLIDLSNIHIQDHQIPIETFTKDTTNFAGFHNHQKINSFSRAEGFKLSDLKDYFKLMKKAGLDSVYVYYGDSIANVAAVDKRKFLAIFWKSPYITNNPLVQTGTTSTPIPPYDAGSLWP